MPRRDALMLRVRELSVSEGQALSRLARCTKDVTMMKRAMVVLHPYQGFSPPKIARMVWWREDWVQRIIKDFNRMGRDALYPRKAPGAPPTFTEEHRQALVDLALSSPRDHGMPIQTWGLERLRDAAIHEGIVEHISKERLRQILHEEATSFQAVKTWKESRNPEVPGEAEANPGAHGPEAQPADRRGGGRDGADLPPPVGGSHVGP